MVLVTALPALLVRSLKPMFRLTDPSVLLFVMVYAALHEVPEPVTVAA